MPLTTIFLLAIMLKEMSRTEFVRYTQNHLLHTMEYYLSIRDYDSLLVILEKSLYMFTLYPEGMGKVFILCLRLDYLFHH